MKYDKTDVEFDFGPIDQLLEETDVTDIMVNGTDAIYIEKRV